MLKLKSSRWLVDLIWMMRSSDALCAQVVEAEGRKVVHSVVLLTVVLYTQLSKADEAKEEMDE